MADTGCDCLGLDWSTNIGQARQVVGDRVALQGNMDPSVLRGSEESIKAEVATILNSFGGGSGHVFNLGHGITPDIDPEKVKVLVEAVQSQSATK
jgi:uroporphyrinogen decarboxylase